MLVWINRLPTEVLSRIFVIGEDMDQDKGGSEEGKDDGRPTLQFQELVVVCSRTIIERVSSCFMHLLASMPQMEDCCYQRTHGSLFPLCVANFD
jgi:hypothetical protein